MGYPAVILADLPVIYLRLGEGSGSTFADSSGNGYDATLTGTPGYSVTGPLLGPGDDDGAFDTLGAARLARTQTGEFDFTQFSAECWFYLDATAGNNGTLVGLRSTSNGCRFSLHLENATDPAGFQVRSGSSLTTYSGIAISQFEWHHVVLTCDAGAWVIYLDGVQYATFSKTLASQTSRPFVVGADTGAASFFDGYIDEVAYYDSVLTSTQVAAHFAAADPFADLARVTVNALAPTVTVGQNLEADLATVTVNALTPPGVPVTLTADLATVTVLPFVPAVAQATAPTGAESPAYVVKHIGIDGSGATVIPSANPKEIVWELNTHEQATVGIPNTQAMTAVRPLQREIQIYRDDDLLFWGPIIPAETASDQGDVTLDCAGAGWYLTKRFIDKQRENNLTNPSFESGVTGWDQSGIGSAVATAVSTRSYRDGQSVRLVNTVGQEDAYLRQSFSETGTGVGTSVVVVAWFFIDSVTDHANERRGLFVQLSQSGVLKDFDYYPIDAASPQGVWTRAYVKLWIPPGESMSVEVRLYAPDGTIYWDATQAVIYESLSTASGGDVEAKKDVAEISAEIVRFVQKTYAGKSDLNLGTYCPPSGQKLTKHYQFADHIRADQAIAEFVDAGYLDWWVMLFPTTRLFVTNAPRRAIDRTGITLAYGGDRVARYSYTEDGNDTETRVTILGDGNGPDREEAEASDTTDTDGLILQGVYGSTPKTTLQALDDMADEFLRARKTIARLPVITTTQKAGDLIHVLRPGDIVTVDIADGWVQCQGEFRVVKVRLDCVADTLEVTLNEEAA